VQALLEEEADVREDLMMDGAMRDALTAKHENLRSRLLC
jgi:hypothetical protein